MTIRILLLIVAVLALAWAAILGFGFVDDLDLVEDYSGWLAFGLCVAVLAELPLGDRRVGR